MNRMYITMPQLMTSGAPGLGETHQIRCFLKLNLIQNYFQCDKCKAYQLLLKCNGTEIVDLQSII